MASKPKKKGATPAPKKKGAKKPEGQRPLWKSVLKWTLIGIVARESYIALQPRRQRQRDLFNLALYRAKQSGKPLLVVGSPDGGFVHRFIGRDYDCGSKCIDVRGCLECPNYEQGRLEDILPTMGSNSAVIYVANRLEYVDDIEKVSRELDRVSGGDAFLSTIEPWTLTSLLWPGARRQFFESPPDDAQLRWKPLPWSSKKSTTTSYSFGTGQ